ncbi:molybdenum cofactor guanylyltransferase [Sphingomonas hankyongi]|uniref:Molybdenum cofactor guanylyltransferase n=1 Tax=Sphingomonas hankyongi TaxID=2908209 RepID=A0ABT0S306_9SPHN|nr:molybdenum cofactor guanylyltransferase [Sphingomonas hankyongi]
MNLAVIILAGGEGRRIGGAKPLRVLAGKTLIDHAEHLARQWSDKLASAVRDPSQVGGSSLQCIADRPGIDGPLAGLAAALDFAVSIRCDAVLTIPADMPFLPRDLDRQLTQRLGAERAAIASSGGRLHPVCGIWRLSARDELAAYAAAGRRSLKGFAEVVGFKAVEWSDTPLDPFFNINSAEDLETAERLLES